MERFCCKRSSNVFVLSIVWRVCALCFGRMAFPAYRCLFSDVNSAEGSRRCDKIDNKSLTPLLLQLHVDQFVDGTKASQKSVLVADNVVPSPSPSPSLTLSLSRQQHETEKDACERCIQRGEKHPAIKVRRLLTAVTNVAQKTTRCLENGGLGLSTDGTHLFLGLNQSGCRNRSAGRRANVKRYTTARSIKVGRVEHNNGDPTSSEFSGTTRTGSSEYDIAAPES